MTNWIDELKKNGKYKEKKNKNRKEEKWRQNINDCNKTKWNHIQ